MALKKRHGWVRIVRRRLAGRSSPLGALEPLRAAIASFRIGCRWSNPYLPDKGNPPRSGGTAGEAAEARSCCRVSKLVQAFAGMPPHDE